MTDSPGAPSTRRTWLYAGVATVAGLAGAGGAWWRQHPEGSAPTGERLDAAFWAQRFERPEGGEIVFAELRGKPLLLNFWATWCPPCVEEMPMINAFYREVAANGWQVVGLAIDQPSAVRKFLGRTPVGYPIGLAGLAGTDMVKQMGNAAGGLPFTVVVDAAGGVMARKMGKLDAADLQAWRRA
ncbi:TlpA disulfide reductase family protein [Variovorax sp. J22P168]|uniref:TlpA family protein disulfide reductase n=1 Tax=Variovorax jilinensis TaxID=3053513 RepID=UPI0025762C91|nr:TlpA disulfide reductase family protein [Variovorax sp. J22P168]MDM0011212.1 TlpA disulfide reductase family protein [Variovorax sp. J22P168]